ncbi:MAG: HAD-IA family hydrolase [Candidatus Saccharimonadales bacterium]|jgi:phosphoglycolate phosphatase
MKKGTIIFDFDGTIADSFEVVLDIFYELTGREHLTDAQIAAYRKLPMKKIAKDVGLSLSQIPLLLVKGRTIMVQRMPEVKVIPGMQEALKSLHDAGWCLMVISSNSHQNVEAYLRTNDMDQYFYRVYGGVGLFGKTRALRKVIKQNKIERQACFYVGDEVRDMQAAHRARVGAVAVAWGYNDTSILETEKPHAIAETPAQLVDIFTRQ